MQFRSVSTGHPAATLMMGHGKRSRQGVGVGEGDGVGDGVVVWAAAGATATAAASSSDTATAETILVTMVRVGACKGGKQPAARRGGEDVRKQVRATRTHTTGTPWRKGDWRECGNGSSGCCGSCLSESGTGRRGGQSYTPRP